METGNHTTDPPTPPPAPQLAPAQSEVLTGLLPLRCRGNMTAAGAGDPAVLRAQEAEPIPRFCSGVSPCWQQAAVLAPPTFPTADVLKRRDPNGDQRKVAVTPRCSF